MFLLVVFIIHLQNIYCQNKILPGIYQTEEYFHLIKNKKIGLVVNHSSIINNTHLVDTLLSCNFKVVKIFSPEHGFTGKLDAGKHVKNEKLSSNIEIVSLYGKKKKPDKKDLEDIEIMIFDIQDVGVRFYTYISTLHYVMEVCAENNVPLILLDRPNPNGFYVDGPVLKTEYSSFVGLHPVPVVYGMTIGEFSLMINGEKWLSNNLICDLTIVKCKNYTHDSLYKLPVSPSPNLKSMQAIYLYPSLCFFEGTIMSIGRGTEFPFEVIGHPDYPDKNFYFIPKSMPGAKQPLYMGIKCYGIDLRNADFYKSKQINLSLLISTFKKMGSKNSFFNNYFKYLAGTNELYLQILNNLQENEIRKSWQKDIEKFKKIRQKYLLYPDFN